MDHKTTCMKKIPLLLISLFVLNTQAQNATPNEEQKIKEVIHLFFKSLETKDPALMQQTTMDDAQIWRRYNNQPIRIDMRFSKDDLPSMSTLPDLKEIALEYKITVGDGIAMAWVPYEFWVQGAFSHCGIDAFTLFQIDGHWKIMSAAYTIKKENCPHPTEKD